MKESEAELRLTGTTLKVYWHLLGKRDAVSVRELQRELRLSSPSVAAYHLQKLEDLGLVQKNPHGDYELTKMVPIGPLRSFLRISGLMVPRSLFYAAFFSTTLAVYATNFLFPLTLQSLFALFFGLSASFVCLYEAYRQWRLKPF
ncbi:helix-turn-helix domain-containing protein [Candidatus Bathyarchaeota archaeon]|nr:helix-turn-helix domain-containing protein [Candidatus Bathyarchaeota archaeon]MBS7627671.1 helix-turn-helix domain-containing protein [Candidatus Bathyarchaeota archaeon]